jgi:hypothetical protein
MLALAPALAVAACTADQTDLQNKIKAAENKSLASEGIKVTSVSCPSNVQLKKGTKFNCSVDYTEGGKSLTGTYQGQIIDSNNDFEGTLMPGGTSTGTST